MDDQTMREGGAVTGCIEDRSEGGLTGGSEGMKDGSWSRRVEE